MIEQGYPCDQGYPRDLRGYGRNPPDPRWPDHARIAVQFVVNFEEGGENNKRKVGVIGNKEYNEIQQHRGISNTVSKTDPE